MENYQIWGENMHFQTQVYEQASTDLFNMGISVSLSSTIIVMFFLHRAVLCKKTGFVTRVRTEPSQTLKKGSLLHRTVLCNKAMLSNLKQHKKKYNWPHVSCPFPNLRFPHRLIITQCRHLWLCLADAQLAML